MPWLWPLRLAGAAAIAALVGVTWNWRPSGIVDYHFVRQDAPVAIAMILAAIAFSFLRTPRRWEHEIALPRWMALAVAVVLFAIAFSGHWLVMLAYDLSRDEAMATFAAEQFAEGALVTPVPPEWQPFGRAMMPLYFRGSIDPHLAWASGYLPVNSALQAVGGALGHRAIANPLLLLAGLAALWNVARRTWPERRDAAVIAVLLAATSAQLIANAMTSFAMVGHFALNMIWLALFLRNDRIGHAGALGIAFLAMGLHQFHFHPMFAGPFLLWLAFRRRWAMSAIHAVGYTAFFLFWIKVYPAWLAEQAGPAVVEGRPFDMWRYIGDRAGRLVDFRPAVWMLNLVRFFAWQNLALLPLVAMALPLLWRQGARRDGLLLAVAGSCAVGLAFMVYQGNGLGYRYLSGAIGGFCLLAGYGWVRWVPEPGPGRSWAMIKAGCGFVAVFALPFQLIMAHEQVRSPASLYRAAKSADADAVLVDTEHGFLAQDIVQNPPTFERAPRLMDLSLVSPGDLERLCATRRVMRIDRRHYRAAGMREGRIPQPTRERLSVRRAVLDRLACAPPVPLP